jgi:cysteinyl-tRNA synthetase
MDFALWKAAKIGEPAWESPWGAGRPGWHIECSAMSMQYLGETFDIHGGGKDLVFPHHENEIAQSEGATGKPFVKYWLHNGFVNVNHEKMSKSLGNFFTIRDILKEYDAEVLRFFILTAHYRSPIDFSDQNLYEARLGLTRFYEALANAGEFLQQTQPRNQQLEREEIAELSERALSLESRFKEAMDDDFNTALVIGHFFDLVRALNRVTAIPELTNDSAAVVAVKSAAELMVKLGNVLGLFISVPQTWLEKQKHAGLGETGMNPDEIEALISERQAARASRDFARSDQIRDEHAPKGILLLDSAQGTTWKRK